MRIHKAVKDFGGISVQCCIDSGKSRKILEIGEECNTYCRLVRDRWGRAHGRSKIRGMPAVDSHPVRANPPRALSWIAGILAGIALTLAGIGVALWAFAGLGLHEVSRMLQGGQLHINVDQPSVVRQIRALQRIETVSYTMDKIISGERENPILPRFLAGDRLLLVVHGQVIAGLDLSKLQPSDVAVNGRSLSIKLPQAEIFTTSLDNAKTRVYSRDTGLFSSPDPDLEGEVRAEAERQLREAALEDGILNTADSNARQTIRSMLTSLGFSSVDIH